MVASQGNSNEMCIGCICFFLFLCFLVTIINTTNSAFTNYSTATATATTISAGVSGQMVKVFGIQADIWKPPRKDVFLRYNLTSKVS